MSELFARLQGDLNASRKAQDKGATLLLGTVLSEVKNRRIELRRDPEDDDVVDVVRKAIKKRRESVEMYDKAGRGDLADKERAEAAALEKYLPPAVSDDELRVGGSRRNRRWREQHRRRDGQGAPAVQRARRRRNYQRNRS